MSRMPIVALVAVTLIGTWQQARAEDTKPDAAAQKALEDRLKEAENEPAKPTGKVKKVQKGEAGPGAKMGEGGGIWGRLLEQFDANKDKKLTGSERTDAVKDLVKTLNEKEGDIPAQVPDEMAAKITEGRKKMLERADENHDGKVDEKEAEKLLEQMEKMNSPEGQEMRKRLMEKFDENKDGKLDEKEMAKAREFMQKHQARREGKEGKGEGKGPGKGETEKTNDEGVSKMTDAERAKAQADIDRILGGN